MKAWTILGWTHDGAIYCDNCGGDLHHGDQWWPVFASESLDLIGQTCDDCGACFGPDLEWVQDAVMAYRWSRCDSCNTQRPWERSDREARLLARQYKLECACCGRSAVHF